MSGWDTYDYGARGYYAAIGRFASPDPLCEDTYDVSPYAYALNNPLRYNDPTGLSANDTIVNKDIPEVTVVASRINPVGTRAMDPVTGFWGWTEYLAFGRTYNSGQNSNGNYPVLKATWVVNSEGIITGVQPLTGTPPIPVFKGGSLFIKGYQYVDKLKFHKLIKPKILKQVKKIQDFSKTVGSNPDIAVENGMIILQGAKSGPYAGSVLKTELNVLDFFK